MGGGDEFSAGFFHGGTFHGEGSFQGVNLSREIIHWGNLPEILNKILFLCLAFSFRLNFTHGVVKSNCPG